MPIETCVAGFLIEGDRVLLCRRSAQARDLAGFWDLPGGHVEPGESLRAALARELFEELGIAVHGLVECARARSGDRLVVGFRVTAWRGVPAVANHEHDACRWHSASDIAAAAEGIAPGLAPWLRRVLDVAAASEPSAGAGPA